MTNQKPTTIQEMIEERIEMLRKEVHMGPETWEESLEEYMHSLAQELRRRTELEKLSEIEVKLSFLENGSGFMPETNNIVQGFNEARQAQAKRWDDLFDKK